MQNTSFTFHHLSLLYDQSFCFGLSVGQRQNSEMPLSPLGNHYVNFPLFYDILQTKQLLLVDQG